MSFLMMRAMFKFFLTVALTVVGLKCVAPEAAAATAAGVGIELDGKHVCGYVITRDKETRGELVRDLPKHRLTFERDFRIPVDPKNPEMATLEGKIKIISKIAGERKTEATARVLKLVKRDGKWFVEEELFKRILSPQKEIGAP